MFSFAHARSVLPQVWHLPDFLLDPNSFKNSYRHNRQVWHSEYPNRLLTPWGSNATIDALLHALPGEIEQLTGQAVTTQVGYASLDISGSQIMMHRLHPDIAVYVQVYLGEEPAPDMSSVFCSNQHHNQTLEQDYADISEFSQHDLVKIKYRYNHAWLMLNQPRCFFGTAYPVSPNQVRETVCLHFAAKLPAST